MYTTALTFKLRPGCYAEYKKAHDELWPGIAAQMRDEGVHMIIYEFENRLFLHAEAPSHDLVFAEVYEEAWFLHSDASDFLLLCTCSLI